MSMFLVGVACLLVLMFAGPAHAYVDPGSGSMLVQLLLGGALGALVMLRSVLHRLRDSFQRFRSRDQRDPR